ncbi:hypothetical protein L1987_67405 [Smallanthus sonchifolius]|uniref:Uncharacterized protein n=1 Tax=Smallanthus sonchifolius TaxID=185202 RepID=A0ACB9B3V3_9ASTR|nr:hypothetical protein L1987_67405 [Smallanthus sonchifolius]
MGNISASNLTNGYLEFRVWNDEIYIVGTTLIPVADLETMKMMKLFAVMLVMMTTVYVSAAEAPAPAPTSDASTVFVPAAVASVSAFVYAFLF